MLIQHKCCSIFIHVKNRNAADTQQDKLHLLNRNIINVSNKRESVRGDSHASQGKRALTNYQILNVAGISPMESTNRLCWTSIINGYTGVKRTAIVSSLAATLPPMSGSGIWWNVELSASRKNSTEHELERHWCVAALWHHSWWFFG